jgi:hypothetical protein
MCIFMHISFFRFDAHQRFCRPCPQPDATQPHSKSLTQFAHHLYVDTTRRAKHKKAYIASDWVPVDMTAVPALIGEDSNTHVNNFLWAYNVDTQELTRILSCPVGAESTGLHAVDEINGFAYITSNFQHPGDWDSPLHDKVSAFVEPSIEKLYAKRAGAMVGYLSLEMAKS